MANTTWNIWNDNDGVEEKPKRRNPIPTIILFFLILAAVLGIVLLAAYRDGTGFDVLRRYLNYGRAETAGSESVYHYDSSSSNRFAVLGNHLVLLSETRLRILSPDGEEVWSTGVQMKAPALESGGSFVVAYDVGGTELYVLDELGERMKLIADEEEPYISASLNENGWLAVTGEKNGFKCGVQVYNDELEKVYEFDSARRFLSDALVTEDNKTLAAVTLGQDGNAFVSNVVLYDLKETEPFGDYNIEDGLLLTMDQQQDTLVALTDTGLSFAETDGNVVADYLYGEVYLRDYALQGEDFTALLLNRYRSGSVGRLVTVATDGTEIASLDVNTEVLGISAAGRYLAVLYADRLVIYNRDLQVYASLQGADYARDVLMRPDGSALLLGAESAKLFLP